VSDKSERYFNLASYLEEQRIMLTISVMHFNCEKHYKKTASSLRLQHCLCCELWRPWSKIGGDCEKTLSKECVIVTITTLSVMPLLGFLSQISGDCLDFFLLHK
jgi:hypothetical protein